MFWCSCIFIRTPTRIQEHGNWPNQQIHIPFFQKGFLRKKSTFCWFWSLTRIWTVIRMGMPPWIRNRIYVKSWIRKLKRKPMRIHNTGSHPCIILKCVCDWPIMVCGPGVCPWAGEVGAMLLWKISTFFKEKFAFYGLDMELGHEPEQ